MTFGPEPTDGSGAGWMRMPRWQHGLLIALCVLGVLAALVNVVAASSNGARAFHAVIGLLVGGFLVVLVGAYRRRSDS